MKNKKAILITIFASLFALLTVVNMSLASPKSAGENTLDMLEIMTRAFDEAEDLSSSDPLFCYEEYTVKQDENWWTITYCGDCAKKQVHDFVIDFFTCIPPIVP